MVALYIGKRRATARGVEHLAIVEAAGVVDANLVLREVRQCKTLSIANNGDGGACAPTLVL